MVIKWLLVLYKKNLLFNNLYNIFILGQWIQDVRKDDLENNMILCTNDYAFNSKMSSKISSFNEIGNTTVVRRQRITGDPSLDSQIKQQILKLTLDKNLMGVTDTSCPSVSTTRNSEEHTPYINLENSLFEKNNADTMFLNNGISKLSPLNHESMLNTNADEISIVVKENLLKTDIEVCDKQLNVILVPLSLKNSEEILEQSDSQGVKSATLTPSLQHSQCTSIKRRSKSDCISEFENVEIEKSELNFISERQIEVDKVIENSFSCDSTSITNIEKAIKAPVLDCDDIPTATVNGQMRNAMEIVSENNLTTRYV